MRIENLAFSIEDNRSYIIEEQNHAILVDAPSESLVQIIRERQLTLDYVFLTHEHCDHIWGLNAIRAVFHAPVIATKPTSLAIGDPRQNRASVHHIYITLRFGADASRRCTPDPRLHCDRADIEFEGKYHMNWQGHVMRFFSTPGHSGGSGMLLADGRYLFSGDTLLKGQSVFTRFESGDSEAYRSVTQPFLELLPGDLQVYPGHGKAFLLKEFGLLGE